MIQEAMYTRLSTFAGLTALVATRVYPRIMPQNPVYPAVTYFVVSINRQSAMGADSGLSSARVQVSCWGVTFINARDVREQVRAALQRYRGTQAGVVIQDIFIEDDTDMPPEIVDGVTVFQLVSDFTVWFLEA